jgi:hypothetical protein
VPTGPWTDIGDELRTAGRAEWLVADVSLARALFSGVPVARLLARTRLASDEADLSSTPLGAEPFSRWDALMKSLLGRSPATLERVKRQIGRQARAASDEGPLAASPGVVAMLAYATAASTDPDSSMAEAFASREDGGRLDPQVAAAVAEYEPRLLLQLSDPKVALFETCVRLTARASAGPLPIERLADASRQLASSEARLSLVRRSDEPLYPIDLATEIAPGDRRMLRLVRSELDALVTRDPRELAAIVARTPSEGSREAHLDSLIADLARLLAHPGALVLAAPMLEPEVKGEIVGVPSSRSPSWLPSDWSSGDAGAAMADALERGATTQPRLRAAIERGGEPALDAIGAEMLRVGSHPFASAAFAELLARSGRTRDIVRLVTYFAVAPDPAPAARALSQCASPELPGMLTAWLEAMLPHDGAQAPHGADPVTSSGARLMTCIASLAPYPNLYRAVRPLLSRVSEAPPPG